MRNLLVVFISCLLLAACKKDEIIYNNVAPPDQTVENVTISNYVNRVYVTVLGHQPDSLHKSSGFAVLRNNNLSMASRKQFLDSVFADPSYLAHLYDQARIDLLKNLDTADISRQIFILQFLLSDSTYMPFWDILRYEIVRLDSLARVPADLQSHKLDINHLHSRCIDNFFYDQINMGTENFVTSCFQHFLNRYPTAYELAQGKNIVDGVVPGILFLQSGQGKPDFLNIFFNSTNYFEGLVTNLYLRLLLRAPTSTEMGNATQKFRQTPDYEQMQKDILSTNEFIGIN